MEEDPNLLVGRETSDDAGVYCLSEDTALVQTLDFITPVVNDPYDFGRIAASNASSDVYAMGGRPLTAMNVVCFPVKSMDKAVLREILRGGLEKIHKAGAALVGGHSVEDPEIKYGLSVTGVVHPERVLTNAGVKPGDAIILTKPLGTGLFTRIAIPSFPHVPGGNDEQRTGMTNEWQEISARVLKRTVAANQSMEPST